MQRIRETHQFKQRQKETKKSWWIPVWKGLVFDSRSKHRIGMGTSIWVYLYLLFSVNRKTGIVSKKQKDTAEDTGLTVRAVQKHLSRLEKNGYILVDRSSKPAKIRITKWKLFIQRLSDNEKVLKADPPPNNELTIPDMHNSDPQTNNSPPTNESRQYLK